MAVAEQHIGKRLLASTSLLLLSATFGMGCKEATSPPPSNNEEKTRPSHHQTVQNIVTTHGSTVIINGKTITGDCMENGAEPSELHSRDYTSTITPTNIKEVVVSGSLDVAIMNGVSTSGTLRITTEENIHNNNIVAYQRGKKLHLGLKGCVTTSHPIEVDLQLPHSINYLDLSGSSDVVVKGIQTPELEIESSGSSTVEVEATVGTLSVDLSGSSDITLQGIANNMSVSMTGASEVDSSALKAQTAALEVSGTGEIVANVEKTVSIDCSGTAEILLIGNAAITDQEVAGVCSIERK